MNPHNLKVGQVIWYASQYPSAYPPCEKTLVKVGREYAYFRKHNHSYDNATMIRVHLDTGFIHRDDHPYGRCFLSQQHEVETLAKEELIRKERETLRRAWLDATSRIPNSPPGDTRRLTRSPEYRTIHEHQRRNYREQIII